MLCLIRTKACQRCGGDLSLECDIYGVYAQCIQCGATLSKRVMLPAAVKPAAAQGARPVAAVSKQAAPTRK